MSPEGKSRRFAYPPNLYVVDGGAPQVNAASAVLDELGITDVAVIGLAKRLEEVWVPSEPDPIILPRNSEGLYLLQRVRDEAHRFAINYHRSKRSKRMTASALDCGARAWASIAARRWSPISGRWPGSRRPRSTRSPPFRASGLRRRPRCSTRCEAALPDRMLPTQDRVAERASG